MFYLRRTLPNYLRTFLHENTVLAIGLTDQSDYSMLLIGQTFHPHSRAKKNIYIFISQYPFANREACGFAVSVREVAPRIHSAEQPASRSCDCVYTRSVLVLATPPLTPESYSPWPISGTRMWSPATPARSAAAASARSLTLPCGRVPSSS